MCGIAGVFASDLSDENISHISKQLLHSLKHRGPDDSGTWFDKEYGLLLAHRRLSIHDLSTSGAQPMHSRSKRFCIVFNGEIYNYQELRTELLAKGHSFFSDSDTEVLLAAIEEWGISDAITKFSGMFAFAVWDKKDTTLYLCRDRLGEKPLYYGWINNGFCFSSELHAIEAICNPGELSVSNTGLMHYLRYGYIPSPHTIYENIHKLPQGSILKLKPTHAHQKHHTAVPSKYWSLLDYANYGLSHPINDFNEAVDLLDSNLTKVISRQLNADVGVGLFLSGGIDSTTVSAIAQNVSSSRIKTFTIGFKEKEYDESTHAEKIAKYIDSDHTTLFLSTNEARDVIPELPQIYDEPFADSSQIPAYLVSKLARQHVTVCLSGDGGDELFAGYNRYNLTKSIWDKTKLAPLPARKFLAYLLEKNPLSIRDKVISKIYTNSQGSIQSKIQKLIELLRSPDIMHAYDVLSAYWTAPEKIINSFTKNECINFQYPATNNFIDQAMYIDQIRYLEGDNLVKTDRASMAVSLETRLPLLSHEIVELAWRIPIGMKVHGNISKWVLRNVLYRYIPESLVNRPKMGFSVPISNWLKNELREWAGDLLLSLNSNNDYLLNPESIIRAWNEHQNGKFDHANKLWTILMYIAWKNKRQIS